MELVQFLGNPKNNVVPINYKSSKELSIHEKQIPVFNGIRHPIFVWC